MKHSLLSVGLALACAASAAQSQSPPAQCLPASGSSSMAASQLYFHAGSLGVCVQYRCYLDRFTPDFPTAMQTVTRCGLLSELPKVGGRVQTIMKAADPLRSLQTAGQRFPALPLEDPAFSALLTELGAK